MLNKIKYWFYDSIVNGCHIAGAWCNKRAAATLKLSDKFLTIGRKALSKMDELDEMEEGLE